MMLRAIGLLCVLLLCAGFWHGSGSTSAPVVTNATFSPSVPASTNQAVGTVSATNSPTSWSITAGDPSGDFAISNAGAITFTAQGATDYNGGVNLKSATLTVQASNGSTGSGIVTVNGYADGSVNASTNAAQYSTFFNGYAARPPWKVAGVDYAAGSLSTCTQADPFPASAPASTFPGHPFTQTSGIWYGSNGNGTPGPGNFAVSFNPTTNRIVVQGALGANTTIDCWDFTIETNGWGIDILANNVTVSNNNFKQTASMPTPIWFDNAAVQNGGTAKYNTIDGNATDNTDSTHCLIDLFANSAGGTWTFEYNYLKNAWADSFCVGGQAAATVVTKFNLIENNGMACSACGAHPDYYQSGGGGMTYTSATTDFNTLYQFTAAASGATQGVGYEQSGAVFDAGDISYNSFRFLANTHVNEFSETDSTNSVQAVTIQSNYGDGTGLVVSFHQNFTHGGSQNKPSVCSGNINIVNGTQPANWNASC